MRSKSFSLIVLQWCQNFSTLKLLQAFAIFVAYFLKRVFCRPVFSSRFSCFFFSCQLRFPRANARRSAKPHSLSFLLPFNSKILVIFVLSQYCVQLNKLSFGFQIIEARKKSFKTEGCFSIFCDFFQ